MAIYPAQIDTFTPVSGTTLVATDDHANRHNVTGSVITAIETAIGTTGGTAVLKNIGAGKFAVADNGGTLNSGMLGTPTIVVGSDAPRDIYFRSPAGTLNRLAAGTAGQVLTSQGTGADPIWSSISTAVPNNYTYNVATGTATSGTTFTNIDGTNLVGTIVTTGTNKVRVSFSSEFGNNSTGNPINSFQILRDHSGTIGTVAMVQTQNPNPPLAQFVTLYTVDNPVNGTNIYSVKYKTSAGTLTLLDQAGMINFSVEEIKQG